MYDQKQTITMWCSNQSRGRDYLVLGTVWKEKESEKSVSKIMVNMNNDNNNNNNL